MTDSEDGGPEPLPEGFFERVTRDLGREEDFRLGERAVDESLLSREQLAALFHETSLGPADGPPLRDILVERGLVPRAEVERLAGGAAGVPERMTLGRYEIQEKLGEGATAVVYRARDRELGRPVAIKVLKETFLTHEIARARYLREAQALARMDHPHVVRVFDSGEHEGHSFLVMELVEGRSFGRLLAERLATREEYLSILARAARGIQHAHEKGIIHRDLKPENLMVVETGDPKVTDFGLAHLMESAPSLTRAGSVIGTPMYMAPEQVRGAPADVTARTDVYGLGAILYEAMTGRPPFQATASHELYGKILEEEPAPPRSIDPAIPVEVEAVILKAMEKVPARRYASAAELAEDLERFLRGDEVLARPPSAWSRLGRGARQRLPVLIPAGTALLVMVLAAGVLLRSAEAARRSREANRLLEAARPALDKATLAQYDPASNAGSLLGPAGEAEALILRAVELDPRLALASYRLGEVQELKGEYDRAIASWEKAIRLDQAFGPAHFRLGRILIWKSYVTGIYIWVPHRDVRSPEAEGLAARAAHEIEEARKTGSGFDDTLQQRLAAGMLAWARSEREAARRVAIEGLGEFPERRGVEDFHWLQGLAEQKPDDRIEAFSRAIGLRPKFPLALYARARAWHDKDDLDAALKDYDAVIRLAPSFMEAYVYRGTIRFQKKDAAGALEDFDRLIREGALLAVARNGRGWTRLELLDDVDGAIADLDEAIRLKPRDYILPYVARAQARLRRGDWDGVISDCTSALEMIDWDFLRLDRVRARLAMGDEEGALRDLKAIRQPPSLGALRADVERLKAGLKK
jgi:tetratricopeptide (TPR) repeat protein/tRNA A-37 threonylcarbamoyl transferase component Bud32